jgi:hypothetical protein
LHADERRDTGIASHGIQSMAMIGAGTPAQAARVSEPGAMSVCVRDLAQMFNPIDPSPLGERDLTEETERFIVSWARDIPAGAPLSLTVEVSRGTALRDPGPLVQQAVHVFFARRAETSERELRAMLRRGRTSLVIGLLFLTACVIAGDVIGNALRDGHLADVAREGFAVAGWVAMWRPMEIFLYNWWPLAGDRRLYTRLSRMPVRVERAGGESAGVPLSSRAARSPDPLRQPVAPEASSRSPRSR